MKAKHAEPSVVALHPRSSPAAVPPDGEKQPPAPRTAAAIDEAQRLQADRRVPFRVRISQDVDGGAIIGSPHTDAAGFAAGYRETFGTASNAFADRQMALLMDVLRAPEALPSEDAVNAALAFIAGQNPGDELEAALVVQMTGTHEASMRFLAMAMLAKHLELQERYLNMATKLQRTFATQVEALKRHRSTGEQTIRVQHQNVVVQDGGQAIVGDVQTGGGKRG